MNKDGSVAKTLDEAAGTLAANWQRIFRKKPVAMRFARHCLIPFISICEQTCVTILDFEHFLPGNNGMCDSLLPKSNDVVCDTLMSLFLLCDLQLMNIVDACSLEVVSMCLEISFSFADFNSGIENPCVGGIDIIVNFNV